MDDSAPPDDSIRVLLRQLLLFVVLVALFSAGVRFAVVTYNRAVDGYEAFGAIWQTHDMLTIYMRENNGEWPQNWDDLQPSFSITNQGYGAPDLAWVSDRVSVDFGFEPIEFASSTKHHDGPLRVLQLPDGKDNGETQSANQRLKSSILTRASW